MRQTIFGPVWQGVPSPYAPHAHPWPNNRYHGIIATEPKSGFTHRASSFKVPPFAGLAQAAPLQTLTGSRMIDAALGGVIGFLGAGSSGAALGFTVAGVAAGYLGGTLGLAAVLAAEVVAGVPRARETFGLDKRGGGGRAGYSRGLTRYGTDD